MNKILFKISNYPQVSETFITEQIITAIDLGYDVQVLVKRVLNIDESLQRSIIEQYGIDKAIIEESNLFRPSANWIYKSLKILSK